MSKSMADTSNIFTNGVIFSTLKTDPHTVRGRSTKKDGVCNDRAYILKRVVLRTQNGKINKRFSGFSEGRSYQNHTRNQMSSQWTENVDRMLLQTTEEHLLIKTRCVGFKLGNNNKDAMLDCESGFHQSEDKRKLNFGLIVISLGLVM